MVEITRERIILTVFEACADLDECYPAGEARKLATKIADRLFPHPIDVGYTKRETPLQPMPEFPVQPKPQPYVDPAVGLGNKHIPQSWRQPQEPMNPSMLHNPPISGPDGDDILPGSGNVV